jgi:GNAT superfamily N-acetyltransferase
MDARKISAGDLDEVVALLTVTFLNTPFHRYIAPELHERLRFLEASYRYRISHGLEVNDIDVATLDGEITGVMSWSPPVLLTPAATPAGSAMDEALSFCSAGLRERFSAFFTQLSRVRDEVIQQPYWSLGPIAVLPKHQGKGIGSLLLREKLRQIDGERLPCFLATQDAGNVPLYEHFGFRLIRQDPIAQAVTHYTMLRQA